MSTSHDLRHTFGSVLAASGEGQKVIHTLMSHSDPGMTDRYLHLQADPLRAAAGNLGERLDAALHSKSEIIKAKAKARSKR